MSLPPVVTPPEPLPVRYWDELDIVSPPDRLVRKLLGTTALALVFGEPGCGKTFLATDMGLHIALGRPWFGRAVTQGAVLYVAAEGAAGLSNRIAAFRQSNSLPGDVPFAVVPAAINLGPGGQDAPRIIDAAKAIEARTGHPVHLIVVDTLARAMGAGDENGAQDMGAFIAACDKIRVGTSATVIIVHHRGKSQQAGARGSSALLGAVDTAVEVEKLSGARVARVVKQKDGAEGETFGFELDAVIVGHDDDGEPISSCIVVPAESAALTDRAKCKEPRGNTGIVFKALKRAITDAGADAPASNHIPKAVRVVSTDLWREYAYKMMAEGTPAARQKAFVRGKDSLLGTGHASAWADHAWVP